MQIAIAQINPVVGDFAANLQKILRAYDEAAKAGADLVITPELAITGYPPRDLLDRPRFIREAFNTLETLRQKVKGPALLVGAVVSRPGHDILDFDGQISNGAVLIEDQKFIAVHRKILLPTYDVFDEARYFVPGETATVCDWRGYKLAITVCEDVWIDVTHLSEKLYERDPVAEQAKAGAQLLLNLSASPYYRGRPAERRKILEKTATKHGLPIVYANQVGGNDSLIFDGRSLIINPDSPALLVGKVCEENVALLDFDGATLRTTPKSEPIQDDNRWEAEVLSALELGLRDYLQKCGFKSCVLGLSGGIDSAITAAIAERALGAENVRTIAMPSRYSSQGSIDDAELLAKRIGIRLDTISVEPMFNAYLEALKPAFDGLKPDVTEENLQARIRGGLLMAYSNKFGSLLLTTGNKSEVAVGYATLYGDMAGGLSVISDLYKNDVYALSRYINEIDERHPIPENTITKPPSAELREDQTDQDSLPEYDILDAILHLFVDEALGVDAIIEKGFDAAVVERIAKLVIRAEYKRRQAAPGLRISPKAFGEGRRLPIAQGFLG